MNRKEVEQIIGKEVNNWMQQRIKINGKKMNF